MFRRTLALLAGIRSATQEEELFWVFYRQHPEKDRVD
jgi:hypothetical protein